MYEISHAFNLSLADLVCGTGRWGGAGRSNQRSICIIAYEYSIHLLISIAMKTGPIINVAKIIHPSLLRM